jgi:hypothetical protein
MRVGLTCVATFSAAYAKIRSYSVVFRNNMLIYVHYASKKQCVAPVRLLVWTIIIMADPKMKSIKATTASIRPIFSPPATHIRIVVRKLILWCFIDACSTDCGAESFM